MSLFNLGSGIRGNVAAVVGTAPSSAPPVSISTMMSAGIDA